MAELAQAEGPAVRPLVVAVAAILAYVLLASLYQLGPALGLPLGLRNGVGLTLFSLLNASAPILYAWLYRRVPRMQLRLAVAFALPLAWVVRELVASYLVLGPGGLAVGLASLLYLEMQAVTVGLVDLVCRILHRRSDPSVPLVGWHSLLIGIPVLLTAIAWIVAASLLG